MKTPKKARGLGPSSQDKTAASAVSRTSMHSKHKVSLQSLWFPKGKLLFQFIASYVWCSTEKLALATLELKKD